MHVNCAQKFTNPKVIIKRHTALRQYSKKNCFIVLVELYLIELLTHVSFFKLISMV